MAGIPRLLGALPLCVCMQIWRLRRPGHARDPGPVNRLLKSRIALPIAIVDQLLARGEEAPVYHGDVSRSLHHPALIGIRVSWRFRMFPTV